MAEPTPNINLEKPKSKELEPVTVDFGLRTVSNFFLLDRATDWVSVGGRDLPISKTGITFYKFEVEGQYGNGLVDKFASHSSEPQPFDKRRIDYSSYFEVENLSLFPSFARVTQGDNARVNNVPVESSRPFIHIETKILNTDQTKELIQKGYPLYIAAQPEDHELMFRDRRGVPISESAKERRSKMRQEDKNLFEPIVVANQPVLWSDKELSQNDDLLYWLSAAYLRLSKLSIPSGISINLPDRYGGVVTNIKQKVLIAQSLTHLLGRPLTYHTEDVNIQTYFPKEIGFAKRAENLDVSQDNVNYLKRVMSEIFQKAWPEAHQEWIARKLNISG